MEKRTKFYGFLFKNKNQLQFCKKLFTYGSGTYMKDFNEQQKSRKKQWLKCILKNIYRADPVQNNENRNTSAV